MPPINAERMRLAQDAARSNNWKRWGSYLPERQWATVREDYSSDAVTWEYFPHDHARSRAYRWGEDGLLGITDRQCRHGFHAYLIEGCADAVNPQLSGTKAASHYLLRLAAGERQ